MPLLELSPQQQRVLDPGIRVVEAGPGSGKTRALVARFLKAASYTGRGVALLSFTNAAVDEVRRRSGESPYFLQAPNFVGTIDSFLHRFIVTPAEVARLGRLPTYYATWDDLPSALRTIRVSQVPGAGVRLSRFRMIPGGKVVLDESHLEWPAHQYVAEVDGLGRRGDLLSLAATRMSGFVGSGTFDSNTARLRANEILSGSEGDSTLRRLAGRFAEVLVDEAQDCDQAEIEIIKRLAAQTTTVVVADPDQAIYEFRGSDPRFFLEYRDEHDDSQVAELAVNHRSASSICRAISSLRVAGTSGVAAAEGSQDGLVAVLSGTPVQQREKFLSILEERGIAPSEAIVLAHRASDAAAVAGRSLTEESSSAVGNRLVAACAVLRRTNATAGQRLDAVKRVERVILLLVTWPNRLRTAGVRAQLDALGENAEWLRTAAGRLIAGLRSVPDRDQFGARARQLLKRILDPLPFECASLSASVKKPDAPIWDRCNLSAEDELAMLPSNTIHGAKGAEFEAVLVALAAKVRRNQKRGVLDDWEEGLNTEARRVLYVGASRARSVLAFGAGTHADRVAQQLESTGTTIQQM